MNDRQNEAGFTMLATMIAMSVIFVISVVAVKAVNGDVHSLRRNLDQKQAYEAAKAGINEYAFRLASDSRFWSQCSETSIAPVNQVNASPLKTRQVPGETGSTYAIEMIPASTNPYGVEQCYSAKTTSLEKSRNSEIETGQKAPGTFRIRSTGFAGAARASIVATFAPPSFLNYVYFTDLETSDKSVYATTDPEVLEKIETQCNLTYEAGRMEKPIREFINEKGKVQKEYCNVISFHENDEIKGPMHTNDSFSVTGYPILGRKGDKVETVGIKTPQKNPYSGWFASDSGKPIFEGTYEQGAKYIPLPESNKELEAVTQPKFLFEGQVRICLKGNEMTVGSEGTCTGKYSGPLPSNGVVFVKSKPGCVSNYSPYLATYPAESLCGNAYVRGTYTGQLTIAAGNDLIINGNVEQSGTGLLGLVANNFVRVYHPFCASSEPSCTSKTAVTNDAATAECNGGVNGTSTGTSGPGAMPSTIEAALMSVQHSFIVDHFDCGAPLGALNLRGSVVQKYRGWIAWLQHGWDKHYTYDERLQYESPPHFLAPQVGGWNITRESASQLGEPVN